MATGRGARCAGRDLTPHRLAVIGPLLIEIKRTDENARLRKINVVRAFVAGRVERERRVQRLRTEPEITLIGTHRLAAGIRILVIVVNTPGGRVVEVIGRRLKTRVHLKRFSRRAVHGPGQLQRQRQVTRFHRIGADHVRVITRRIRFKLDRRRLGLAAHPHTELERILQFVQLRHAGPDVLEPPRIRPGRFRGGDTRLRQIPAVQQADLELDLFTRLERCGGRVQGFNPRASLIVPHANATDITVLRCRSRKAQQPGPHHRGHTTHHYTCLHFVPPFLK